MRSTSLLASLVLAASGTLGLAAYAADTAEGGKMSEFPFEEVDANGDGSITQQEAQGTPLEGAFAQTDQNGNGEVDQAEYAAFQLQQAGEGTPEPTEVPEGGGLTGS